jgi:hypothetical protein
MFFKRVQHLTYWIQVSALISLLYCLTACGPDNRQGSSETPEPPRTIMPRVDPTNDPSGTPKKEPAPSYDEIYNTMRILAKYDVNPDGPAVGDDGLVDAEIRNAVEGYEASLLGRQAIGWMGWVKNVSQARIGQTSGGFNLQVVMADPVSNPDIAKMVLLSKVPIEQVEKIYPRLDLQQPFDEWANPLPMIRFDGTITDVSYTGRVEIGDVTLEQMIIQDESTLLDLD